MLVEPHKSNDSKMMGKRFKCALKFNIYTPLNLMPR